MTGADGGQVQEAILTAFRKQIGWCEVLGSPFTARVLTLLAEDFRAGGPAADLVGTCQGDPVGQAVTLRFAAALHGLVLMGTAPELAACYPPHASPSPERLRSVLSHALAEHSDVIRTFLASPPQTNEVGRSAVLLGGFLQIAHATRLPLRLLEIGASAGLNTIWDHYRYDLGAAAWGDPASPVRLAPDWTGALPPLDAKLQVAERRACDVAPIDLGDGGQRLRLAAYVWPDHRERLARLNHAISVARAVGTHVEQADAAAWVRARLDEHVAGCATVLFHSIVWQYLPGPVQDDISDSVRRAGQRATADSPVAWLRFEPSALEGRPELRLTLWPDGRERRLATATPHGTKVQWLGG